MAMPVEVLRRFQNGKGTAGYLSMGTHYKIGKLIYPFYQMLRIIGVSGGVPISVDNFRSAAFQEFSLNGFS